MGSNGPSWGRRQVRVRMAEEAARRAQQDADRAQREADRLMIIAWNERMAEGGPALPSPTIGQAMACGYKFLRVRCTTCRTQAWLALELLDRPKETPGWKIEGKLACTSCAGGGARAPRATIEQLTIGKSYGADEVRPER